MNAGPTTISFDAFFDDEASVWVATSDDHMTTEAESREALLDRLRAVVPDVLEERLGHAPSGVKIIVTWREMRAVGQTELMVA